MFDSLIVVKKSAAIVPKTTPVFNPLQKNDYTERIFKSMFVSVVGGFYFEVLHRMEGKWSASNVIPQEVSKLN